MAENNYLKRLLIQSDDYGITPAVSCGIVEGIKNGIIRNTGIFMNMPWTKECAERIKPYLNQIALGIDLNITTGRPLSDAKDISTIIRANGAFYSSSESYEMDREVQRCHASIDEVRCEYETQIKLYQDIFGKAPDYIHGHAYITKEIVALQRELAQKYSIPYSVDVHRALTGKEIFQNVCPWYIKPASMANQMKSSLKDYLLSADFFESPISMVIGHMGYVDKELFALSSYNLYRLNDLAAVTDPEVLDWVAENKIKLITYKDWQDETT